MEPLHPDLREALKSAHPGLTDSDIDHAEELLAERMRHDPLHEAELIRKLDQERLGLLRRKMPHYSAIVQAFNAQRSTAFPSAPVKVTVTPKKPSE